MPWPPSGEPGRFDDLRHWQPPQPEQARLTSAEQATFDELELGYFGRRGAVRVVKRAAVRTRAGLVAFALEWAVAVLGVLAAVAVMFSRPAAFAGVAALTICLVALLRHCRRHGMLCAGRRRRHRR